MALTPRPARIEVEIRELVLHAFAPTDRLRIGDAVRAELGRLLAERGLAEHAAARSLPGPLDAGTIRLAADGRPETTGHRIAQAVHGALGP